MTAPVPPLFDLVFESSINSLLEGGVFITFTFLTNLINVDQATEGVGRCAGHIDGKRVQFFFHYTYTVR